MAIQMKLGKEYNHLNFDFNESYWVIRYNNMRIEEDNIVRYLFSLEAYANKDSKEASFSNKEFNQSLGVGGAFYPMASRNTNLLYCWEHEGLATEIFPNGIPTDRNAQLTACYEFVKRRMNLQEGEYIDV